MKRATTTQFRDAVRAVATRAGSYVQESWTDKCRDSGNRIVCMMIRHPLESTALDVEVVRHLVTLGLTANTRAYLTHRGAWVGTPFMYIRGTCTYQGDANEQ